MRRLTVLVAFLIAGAAAAPAHAARLVRYDVGGGIAGLSERLVVERDGRAHQTDSRGDEHRFRLSPRGLRALKRDLKAARFPSLKRSYRPDRLVLDGTTRLVRHRGRTVSVSTGADVPVRLQRLLRRLGRLLR